MKKGFTLIELLAVIVILAIIALIATPIVLNIINETKESADLRSAEMYLDAVEQSIARSMLQNKYISDGTYNISSNGDICLNENCSETLAVEVDGEKPKSGNIAIINGTIDGASLELGNKTLGISGNGGVAPVCTLVSGTPKALGAKYECEVRPGGKQIFYVLSEGDNGTTNLIMDRNVYYDASTNTRGLTDKDHDGLVVWINKEDYEKAGGTNYGEYGNNEYGPITAMNYLNNATSTWSNVPNLNITYNDEGNHFTNFQITGKARLPRLDEVSGTGKCATCYESCELDLYGSCPLYLANYLDNSEYVTGEGLENISGIRGYWTLDASYGDYYDAWNVTFFGIVSGNGMVGNDNSIGVRPVINVKL